MGQQMFKLASLVLDDGTVVRGAFFGAVRQCYGELVFNTGMTGYQEALTDPSYNGQILMMTYPLIGNYGISRECFESEKVQAEGFVVHQACSKPHHYTSIMTLDEFLLRHEVPGISGLDTRSLTIRTRSRGTMRAAIVEDNEEVIAEAIKKTATMPFPDASNLVAEVSTHKPHALRNLTDKAGVPTVVVIDCGVKAGILRNLRNFADVVVVPWNSPPDLIMGFKPDGIMVSNGPGDPAHKEMMDNTVKTVKTVMAEVPMMGICLGHQLIGLSLGAKTYKLKFGHRGANQPVRQVGTHIVRITSQNHGFAIDPDSMPSEAEVLETNVNDGTVEALRHKELPVVSWQYHPEAQPGPLDSIPLFEAFAKAIKDRRWP